MVACISVPLSSRCGARRLNEPHDQVKGWQYGVPVLEAGVRVPDVRVWVAPREEATPIREVLADGLALLCFYVHDWSPT